MWRDLVYEPLEAKCAIIRSLFSGDAYADSLKDLTADVMGVDLKNAKGGCECACKQHYKP